MYTKICQSHGVLGLGMSGLRPEACVLATIDAEPRSGTPGETGTTDASGQSMRMTTAKHDDECKYKQLNKHVHQEINISRLVCGILKYVTVCYCNVLPASQFSTTRL